MRKSEWRSGGRCQFRDSGFNHISGSITFSGFGIRASNHIFGIRGSEFGIRASNHIFGIRDPGFGPRITFSGFGIRASNHIFRDLGFGSHIFGIRDSGFGPRITFFGIWDSGFGPRITFWGFGLDLRLACFFLFPPPNGCFFSKTAIFESTHAFLETSDCFFLDLVHKGVKQQDRGQTARPHNGRNSPHKAANSRKRAQFQEAYFLAVPLPFSIDDHLLSKRHGLHDTDGTDVFPAKKPCS